MSEETGTSTATQTAVETQVIPPYNLILVNDEDHSYPYVIEMLCKLFGWGEEEARTATDKIDKEGSALLVTGNKEYVEFKQAQIHAYGPDPKIPHCKGSMTAYIEPVV